MTPYKQPVSVLVVIYTAEPLTELRTDLEVLLLERADHPGYWQSVTGSCEPGESLRDTALREVLEETGLDVSQYTLSDWQVRNEYEIYPHWRHRYPPGITRNTEHVFGLQLPHPIAVRLAPSEHLNFQWLAWQDAAQKVFSSSNRAAILELPSRASRKMP
ncbi:MAG: dihydroneopterin triphosphate diphosphatase [Gallionellales bacterium RIFCSPLOWO2_12_FULL_59_22]|nr:MAG: dihydroneopterin triphosphate diphosphatase [Gallionellales bacterium RIFCSPLOWO2_02_FULL_59_110]OGT02610.1 MAG: dihydroneopterin triphosphate diphosphatase [Gallionellales bacterium RIFCSPLOWO2_02_58_13]OGT13547.1 MAG: dihydroneopterin triphosphate diphosphatase [Gallionellales bacterium RIFCSPLOWO2_12_FULL_59_22]